MFANQAEWLGRSVSGAVLRIGTPDVSMAGTLVVAGSRAVAIIPAEPGPIDQALTWLRESGSPEALIWSASVNPVADIALVARGGRDSFAPRWMWKAPDRTMRPRALGDEIAIAIATRADREALLTTTSVPYVSPATCSALLDLATAPESPRRIWMVLALRRSRFGTPKLVGIGILHLSDFDGSLVGGIYNLGVDPDWRRKGIGGALTAELCRIAREHGAIGVALNATPQGEHVYRNEGFTVAGDGQTWYLPAAVLGDPPSSMVVTMAEALARGDVDRLQPSLATWAQMPNGESPLRFAARFRQRDACRWLLAHGADPDIVALWSLGFREEAVRSAGDPRRLDVQHGPESTTPLHEAIRLNDPDLVRMLIAAGADLSLRDAQWHGRPLEWVEALGHADLAAMIRRAM